MERLRSLSDHKALELKVHFGSHPAKAYGIWKPHLRRLAREIGVDHALELWSSGVHEARVLATMIDVPKL